MSKKRDRREAVALGAAVRELRTRRRMSQECLAFESTLHRNYIGAVERGENNPTFYTLLRLAQGLDVTLVELFEKVEARHARESRIVSSSATVRRSPTTGHRLATATARKPFGRVRW